MKLGGSTKLDLIRSFGKLTPKTIIKNQYPTIGQLQKTYDNKQIEEVIILLTDDLCNSFNEPLSSEELEEVAVEIMSSNFRNISVEDVFYCYRKLKLSKNFGKLNVNKILKTIQDHFESRIEIIAEQSYNNHLSQSYTGNRQNKQEQELYKRAKAWYYKTKMKDNNSKE